MPKDIQKGMKDLSIRPGAKANDRKSRKALSNLKKQYWLYGFHLKNRYVRRLSEKFGLPYQTDPWSALAIIQRHLIYKCRVHYSFRSIKHRGRNAKFLVFLEDDGRKRLELNEFTKEEMERVRIELLLPEGAKPKWYDVHDNYDDDAELSSEDEPMPPNKRSGTLRAQDERKPDKPKDSKVDVSNKPSDGSGTDEIEESDEDYDSDMYDDYLKMLYGSDSDTEDEDDECHIGSDDVMEAAA